MIPGGNIFQQTGFSALQRLHILPHISAGLDIHVCPKHAIHLVIDKHIFHDAAQVNDQVQFLLYLIVTVNHLEYTACGILLLYQIPPVGRQNVGSIGSKQCDILYYHLPAHRKFLCKCNSRNRCAALGQPLYDFFSSLLSVHAPIRPFNSGRRVLFLQLFDRATNCPYALLSSNGCRFFREMSKIGAECVSAPLEIKSTPRSVSLAIFSLVTLPDTSISALPSM